MNTSCQVSFLYVPPIVQRKFKIGERVIIKGMNYYHPAHVGTVTGYDENNLKVVFDSRGLDDIKFKPIEVGIETKNFKLVEYGSFVFWIAK